MEVVTLDNMVPWLLLAASLWMLYTQIRRREHHNCSQADTVWPKFAVGRVQSPVRRSGPVWALGNDGLRRDEQGYIIREDLKYDMEKRSNDLGASKVDMPEQVQEMLASPSTFATTIETIDTHYEYFGTKFTIADEIENVPPANEGSAKVFSLAFMFNLSTEETLSLFCEHYKDVCADPSGIDHANIRAIMKHGVEQLYFPNGPSLLPREGTFDGATYSSDVPEEYGMEGAGDWDPDSDSWIP